MNFGKALALQLWMLVIPGAVAAQGMPHPEAWNHPLSTPIGDQYRLPSAGLVPLAIEGPNGLPWTLSVREPGGPPDAEPVELCSTPCMLFVPPGRRAIVANDPVTTNLNYMIDVTPRGSHVGLRRPMVGLAIGGGVVIAIAVLGWLGVIGLAALGGSRATGTAIADAVASGVLTVGGFVMVGFSGPRAVAW